VQVTKADPQRATWCSHGGFNNALVAHQHQSCNCWKAWLLTCARRNTVGQTSETASFWIIPQAERCCFEVLHIEQPFVQADHLLQTTKHKALTVRVATSSAILVSALYALPCSMRASTSYRAACRTHHKHRLDALSVSTQHKAHNSSHSSIDPKLYTSGPAHHTGQPAGHIRDTAQHSTQQQPHEHFVASANV
jgi:hypothetical protein